jgi:DNA polymerase-3 subunit delta
MLIFVYGDDSFQVAEKVRFLKDGFRKKYDPTGLNTAEFPTSGKSNIDVGEVMNAVRSMPFLGKKRMVVIRDLIASTKSADEKMWVEGFKGAPDFTVVIFWETTEPSSLEKKPLFVALKDLAEVLKIPFSLLKGADLSKWVVRRVKARGGVITTRALQEFVLRVGSDLWQMNQEIEKLVAYAAGEQITPKIVDELVGASFEKKIFVLMDAISQRRRADAIRLLQEERLAGTDDHLLLTMLGRQVRILLGARAMLDENPRVTKQELVSALALNPFVAQKALAQARSFTVEGLTAVHDLLFEFDQQIKSSQLHTDVAVDLTAVKLMK